MSSQLPSATAATSSDTKADGHRGHPGLTAASESRQHPALMSLKDTLRAGITSRDRVGQQVIYRLLRDSDDLDALTELLHAAYAPLAAAGMRFVASHQDAETTRRRVSAGDSIAAVVGGEVVGTITLASFDRTSGSAFYDRADVMSVGQFAVQPSLGQRGIGSMLLDLAEQLAREHGAAFVGLDTSEHAAHLISFYEARVTDSYSTTAGLR